MNEFKLSGILFYIFQINLLQQSPAITSGNWQSILFNKRLILALDSSSFHQASYNIFYFDTKSFKPCVEEELFNIDSDDAVGAGF